MNLLHRRNARTNKQIGGRHRKCSAPGISRGVQAQNISKEKCSPQPCHCAVSWLPVLSSTSHTSSRALNPQQSSMSHFPLHNSGISARAMPGVNIIYINPSLYNTSRVLTVSWLDPTQCANKHSWLSWLSRLSSYREGAMSLIFPEEVDITKTERLNNLFSFDVDVGIWCLFSSFVCVTTALFTATDGEVGMFLILVTLWYLESALFSPHLHSSWGNYVTLQVNIELLHFYWGFKPKLALSVSDYVIKLFASSHTTVHILVRYRTISLSCRSLV